MNYVGGPDFLPYGCVHLLHFLLFVNYSIVIVQTFSVSVKPAAHLMSIKNVSSAYVTTGGSNISEHLFSVLPHVRTCISHMYYTCTITLLRFFFFFLNVFLSVCTVKGFN